MRSLIGETQSVPNTLDQLAEGQTATILDVDGDDAIAVRLLEMGLTDGETIKALGAAPLGDPLEFEVRGYRISLRINEARRIRLSPAQSATCAD